MDRNNKFGTIYYGKVVEIEDPTKQGRIKVQIEEVYGPDADVKQLPWIYPLGYNAGVRLFNVPDKDTEVGVVFIGDFYTGFYGIGKYPKEEEKVFNEDYPKVYGIEDLQGNYVTINKETGFVKIYHRSKTEITLDKDGNVTAKTPGSVKVEIAKEVEIKASDTVKVDVAKSVDLYCPKTTIQPRENEKTCEVTINGNTTMNGKLTVTNTCTFEGIKWKSHVHPYYWEHDGGRDDTSAPKNP